MFERESKGEVLVDEAASVSVQEEE